MDLRPLAYQALIFHLSATAKLSAPNTATPYTPIITLTYTTGTISTTFVPTTSVQFQPLVPALINSKDTLQTALIYNTLPLVDTHNTVMSLDVQVLFSSSPVMIISASSHNPVGSTDLGTEMKIKAVTKVFFSEWWCINEYFGTI